MKSGITGNSPHISNLQSRILTGVFLGIFVLGVTWFGGFPFILFSVIAGAAVFYEWSRMSLSLQYFSVQVCGWICYMVVALALFSGCSVWVIFLVLSGSIVLLVFLSGHNIGWIAGGFIYSALCPVMLCFLRQHETFGFIAVCFLYAVVWGTDIGAYFCGRAFGGPRLAPGLSPGKTWSGAVGGAVIGTGGGMCVAALMIDGNLSFLSVFSLSLCISAISQAGDLGESGVKRYFQVKDSGYMLPGHGGVMDRVDGLIPASIALYGVGAVVCDADMASGLFAFL